MNAGIPETINYQGYLTDAGGAPIDAVVPITLNLYTVATSNPHGVTAAQVSAASNAVHFERKIREKRRTIRVWRKSAPGLDSSKNNPYMPRNIMT